jgi:ubiquitin carboxyl-terminal hydrolase 1
MNDHLRNLHDYAVPPTRDWQQSFTPTAVILLLVIVISTVIVPLLADPATTSRLQRLASRPLAMAANLSRRISSSAAGKTSSLGLQTVLDTSRILRSPSISSPTRTIASLLRKGNSHAPAGLGNWDNSCYQNSIIQGLAALPSLSSFLSKAVARRGAKPDESTNAALLEVFDKLYDEENNGLNLWLPAKLRSMSTWQQQDAQEYYSKILDQVDKEAVAAAKLSSASSDSRSGLAMVGAYPEETPRQSQLPALRNPLEGLLAQRVACTRCGHSDGLSLIPFNCLTVQLGDSDASDLEDCLDEYTKLEIIPGVQCPKCTLLRRWSQLKRLLQEDDTKADFKASLALRLKVVEEALDLEDFSDAMIVKKCGVKKDNWVLSNKSKQAVIARAPQSLVIHVNRSRFDETTGTQTKNYAEVSCPESLDLGLWCLANAGVEDSGKDEKVELAFDTKPTKSMLPAAEESIVEKYQLRAVVTHHGRHENGHYICYRRHPVKQRLENESNGDGKDEAEEEPTERWWQLSDETVRPVSKEFVLEQGEVFMLFYEKVDAGVSESMSDVDQITIDSATMQPLGVSGAVAEPCPLESVTLPTAKEARAEPVEAEEHELEQSANPASESQQISEHDVDLSGPSKTLQSKRPSPLRDQQYLQAVVMRTASIGQRENLDGGDLESGGFRMVAAT